MLLWVLFAVLVAAVIAALARPMLTDDGPMASAKAADLAVYRDQLAEIETDLDRGLISPTEAASARAELGRRLIKRAEEAETGGPEAGGLLSVVTPEKLAYATAGIVPLVSLALYLSYGSPTLPGMPHSERAQAPAATSDVEQLVAKVEEQLRKTPDDGRGWDAVAPVYLRMGRFDDAARAFAQAMRLQGETPRRLSGFAEASVMANDGIVVDVARKAYVRILEIDPGSQEARFWLALSDEQDGKVAEAKSAYEALLASAPADAPWRSVVENRLAGLSPSEPSKPRSGAEGQPKALPAEDDPGTPGPTSQDVAAAAQMSADERQGFINSMVSRLAEKLKADPNDFEGWLRLVRAYVVLGRKEDASQALESARKSAADDGAKLARLDALATELGLGS